MRILFFGSTTDSVIVATHLYQLHGKHDLHIEAVVTQPPKPAGRDKTMTVTPVEVWATDHAIPVLSFPNDQAKSWLYADEHTVVDTLAPFQADLLISASYGQKIPTATIQAARAGGLNVHPSILPRWRGADPVPWAILSGDHQIGVTVVTLSENFDEGEIIEQKKIPIQPTDTSDPLRTHLFTMGADLLVTILLSFSGNSFTGARQDPAQSTYARRLKRADGFIPWPIIEKAIAGIDAPSEIRPTLLRHSEDHISYAIHRAFRAFTPWPGIWTTIPVNGQEKRVKILDASLSETHLVITNVQMEGKNPTAFTQFSNAYLSGKKG